MSDDDPTMKVPDDEPLYDTKPGITAVLERIDALEEKLTARIDGVEEKLTAAVNELRAEMQTGFKKLERKFDLLTKDTFELRADSSLLQERVDKLEEKVP